MAEGGGNNSREKGLEDRIDALQEQLTDSERRQEQALKDLEERCKSELVQKLRSLDDEFNNTVEHRMSGFEERFNAHSRSSLESKQTEVLRANKVIREVSRGLGEDWTLVFSYLSASFPKEEVHRQIEKIQRQKPFMQPYKALMTWKDKAGRDFNVRHLVKALTECGKMDLAEKALDIMDSEGDALLSLDSVGKGIASAGSLSGADVRTRDGLADGAAACGPLEGHAPTRDHGGAIATAPSVSGTLDDSALLKLSRKLGPLWKEVGRELNIPEPELGEIQANEGDGYQAAFKMLWAWRDSINERNEEIDDHLGTLAIALKTAGRSDLAQELMQ